MLSRRGKPYGPTVLFIALLLIAGYGYYLYNEQYSKFIESKGKLVLVKKKQLSLKSQLQVVYEHRTKLETALIREKKNHRITKNEFIAKIKGCQANLTKAKYEALNRFNALDTEHKMLKAKHEEVNTDYSNLQQQYVRLSEDHQKIVNGQREDFERLKENKEKESRSLQARVRTLFNEKEEQKAEASKYFGYYRSERSERTKLTSTLSELKSKNSDLENQVSLCESERDKFRQKFADAEKEINELEEKIKDLEEKVKQESVNTHYESQKATHAQLTESPRGKATLQLRVHSGPSASLSSDSPSEGVLRSTTSKLERKSVKLKILGKGTQGTDRDSKPSNRMQQLIIGKTTETKKEDSLIDEYKSSDTSKEDGTEDSETHYVGRPTMKLKVHARETQFHDLVIKPTHESSNAHVEEPGIVSSPVQDGNNEDAEKKNQVETNNDKEDMDERASRNEEAALAKGRVSQYSKIKADAEEKEEQANENEKEIMDAGEAFLKKQQMLLHRGTEVEKNMKVEEKGSDSNEKVAGGGKAEETNEVVERHSNQIGNEKIGDGRINGGNSDDNVVEEVDSDKAKGGRVNDGETDNKGADRMSNLKREESEEGNDKSKEEFEESKRGHQQSKERKEEGKGGKEKRNGRNEKGEEGNEETKERNEETKEGNEESKGGNEESKGGNEEGRGGYEETKEGNEESKGGYEETKGGNGESKERYEKTKDGQAATKEGKKETEEEYEKSSILEARKDEERSQLPAPVPRKKKRPARINSEVKRRTEEGKLEGAKAGRVGQGQKRNQLHAPIKKPQPKDLSLDNWKNPHGHEKEDDGHLEDEVGDQDLDKSKNSEDQPENVDAEDDSRTGFR